MECDCSPASSPAKRRKILHENQVNHPKSNEDPNLPSPKEARNTSLACLDESHAACCRTEMTNMEVVVNQNDALNDGKECSPSSSQVDHFDLEKESDNSKIKILIEGSTMDAAEEGGSQVRNEDNRPPQFLGSGGDNHNAHPHSRKKLLVLDVNGLLVDIVADPDEAHKPDTIIGSKAVFKRPFCDEFLKFCFEKFSVGVWTSRTRRNIKRVLDFVMRDTQHQLLFCWDQSHCTETGFNTIENSGKPLVLKELKKLWEKQDPNLPWDRGVYDESNTLFLDDSPYKALRNPPYTAIFPYTYSYRNAQDNGLGPNGDLRTYLERLATSDNVQKFIEQNPFGQQPITYDNESWNFYQKVICSPQPRLGPSRARKKLIVIDLGGLLVDVATFPREGFRADTMHGSTAVFRRPYCDEFLQFCFRRFNIGVWTSTTRYNTERTIDLLMRDTQRKLLFCWDRTDCTDTGFRAVENNRKWIRLKELSKLWTKEDPNLPWELGEYDESNTLLVDNTPHEALLNPPHTAIFPKLYHYWNTEDNSLGPKGDLRVYLERLAASENVQSFVSENSFGQRPIREKNLSWAYYQKSIRALKSRHKARGNRSVDAQCKNSSEPKPDTAIASVTKTLSEQITDTSTALAAPALLEPKPDSNTTLAAHTLVEPETNTTIAMVCQTLSEPEIDTTAPAAQTLLEPETITTTVLTAPTLLEPETNNTTSLVTLTSLEPTTDTTVSAAPTLLEPKPDSTTTSAAHTLMEPETVAATVSAGPTLLELETDTTASGSQI
ncbi:hypothetical protein L1987_64427 [Smallanthus sonchifolius]|uniref:Uncharacterized protein n=1 Tax=Smallanthus sonchifolius TaxID=185202 RepID=A0ACB9CG02_9ASTR|nr:hypothetical protein L1987_64427 [Smallanthus sonchifolius]